MRGIVPNHVENTMRKGGLPTLPNGALVNFDDLLVVRLVIEPYHDLLGTMECFKHCLIPDWEMSYSTLGHG